MDNLEDVIAMAITNHINCHHLDVSGDGQHFEAIVVSDEFENKNRLARHRLVYAALGDRMHQQVHALSMKLYTQQEWESLRG